MIKEPTVLILGAGASVPYEFPSGKELIKKVIYNLDVNNWRNPLTKIAKISEVDVREFRDALVKADPHSIDTFIENRPKYELIGKYCICLLLLPQENITNLSTNIGNETRWYQYVLNKMKEVKDKSLFKSNKISIVTFNYDRSFEQYMYLNITNSYEINDEEYNKYMENIPIIHLYGKLGNLPWESSENKKYSPDWNIEELKHAVSKIKIIYEEHDQDAFATAFQRMMNATYIYFLGNGYHPLNMKRLGVNEINPNVRLYGTTYGFTAKEIGELKDKYRNIDFALPVYDVISFLRNNAIL